MNARPASHYLTGLYSLALSGFFLLEAGYMFVHYGRYLFVNYGLLPYVRPVITAILPVTAFVALLCSRASWVYYLNACLLLVFPAHLIALNGNLLVAGQPTFPLYVAFSLVGIGCLLWLFVAFTFGRASRAYYAKA
jgi:hypothetical protein